MTKPSITPRTRFKPIENNAIRRIHMATSCVLLTKYSLGIFSWQYEVAMKTSFLERGGFWVAAQGLLMLGVLGLSMTFRSRAPCLVCTISGGLLFVIGAVFGVAGARALGSGLTPFPKPRSGAPLVRHGIYSLVRHPLYTSVFLACLGWSLLWRSWPAVGLSLVLGIFFEAKARREERWLREKYEEYEEYAQRTRRFIPLVY